MTPNDGFINFVTRPRNKIGSMHYEVRAKKADYWYELVMDKLFQMSNHSANSKPDNVPRSLDLRKRS